MRFEAQLRPSYAAALLRYAAVAELHGASLTGVRRSQVALALAASLAFALLLYFAIGFAVRLTGSVLTTQATAPIAAQGS